MNSAEFHIRLREIKQRHKLSARGIAKRIPGMKLKAVQKWLWRPFQTPPEAYRQFIIDQLEGRGVAK